MVDERKEKRLGAPCIVNGLKSPFGRQVGGDHYIATMDLAEFFGRNGVPALEASVMKYVYRHKLKGRLEDLRKAKHYLEMIAYIDYEVEL